MRQNGESYVAQIPIDKILSKPSVFDRLIQEILIIQVPVKYIQKLTIHYNDGNVINWAGHELTHSVAVLDTSRWEQLSAVYKRMKEIKIIIDTNLLEKDVNQALDELLGKHFK